MHCINMNLSQIYHKIIKKNSLKIKIKVCYNSFAQQIFQFLTNFIMLVMLEYVLKIFKKQFIFNSLNNISNCQISFN